MPIKRSQSAPQPVVAVFHATKANVTDKATQVALQRSKSYLVSPSVTNSPIATPWVEREDPFSLSGFFPTSRATPEDEQWKWLRREEVAQDEGFQDDQVSVSSFSADDEDSILGELKDELASETIESEDKLGVLSLGMFLN